MADVVAVLVFLFALAFKKGYIKIEVVDEENPTKTKTTILYIKSIFGIKLNESLRNYGKIEVILSEWFDIK